MSKFYLVNGPTYRSMTGGISSTENRTIASAPHVHFPGQPSPLIALFSINSRGISVCSVASSGSSLAHLKVIVGNYNYTSSKHLCPHLPQVHLPPHFTICYSPCGGLVRCFLSSLSHDITYL